MEQAPALLALPLFNRLMDKRNTCSTDSKRLKLNVVEVTWRTEVAENREEPLDYGS